MQGTVSFHPLDLSFFDEFIGALLAGDKVNPEPYLDGAVRFRRNAWRTRRYTRSLETILTGLEPVKPDPAGTMWDKVRTRLDGIGYQPDKLTRRVARLVEPDLHFHGRPFLITEGSPERVSELVDDYRSAGDPSAADSLALEQLVRLDPELAKSVEPEDGPELSADYHYRADLLAALKGIYEVAGAAREGSQQANDALLKEIPWRAVALHARSVPFWIAQNVDGLEAVCQATGIPSPEFLAPAWRLFAGACENFPGLRNSLSVELGASQDIGAFASPGDVSRLLDFLTAHGSKIIRAATRHGEGSTCRTLLLKIRECATYADRHGLGYLEASGILHPDLQEVPER